MVTAVPGVLVTVRDRSYRVAGTSARHLREASKLLCPHRAGTGHLGYTDWRISWSSAPQEKDGGHVVASARVEVVVTCTIPCWVPPRIVDPNLLSSWKALVAAVATHERGHVDIAVGGAHALHAALMSVSPAAPLDDIELRMATVAVSSLDAIRANDRAYDEATAHGALQGVRLPW